MTEDDYWDDIDPQAQIELKLGTLDSSGRKTTPKTWRVTIDFGLAMDKWGRKAWPAVFLMTLLPSGQTIWSNPCHAGNSFKLKLPQGRYEISMAVFKEGSEDIHAFGSDEIRMPRDKRRRITIPVARRKD